MNLTLKTEDRSTIESVVTKLIDDANEIPLMISICNRDGKYTCNASHPPQPEPRSDQINP